MTNSSTQPLKKIVKHSAIYAIGTVIRRITGFVMLPIYTQYLTPEDYGVVELLTMAIEIASILVGLRISQALFRYYILADNDTEKKTIVSTVLLSVLFTSGIGVVFLYNFSAPISQVLFGSEEYSFEVQLFAFTLMSNAISAVGLSYLRARQMPIVFVLIGIVTLVLQVTMNILFVVIYELHVTGVVYSSLISGAFVAVFLGLFVLYSVGFKFSFPIFKRLLDFILPLIVASLGAFYVAYADKYLLRVFSGLADVGLYSLAGRLSGLLLTVFEAFNMSWGADRFEISKREDAKVIFNQVFRYLTAAIVLIAGGVSLFTYDLFLLMTSEAFYAAANIVPLLILATLFRINSIFLNFGIIYAEKTKYLTHASFIKAVVASALWVLLIPKWGATGAAASLLISCVVEMILVYRGSEKFYPLDIDWSKIMHLTFPLLGCIILSYMHLSIGVYDFFLKLIIYVIFVVLLYWVPAWTTEERVAIKAYIVSTYSKIKKSVTK